MEFYFHNALQRDDDGTMGPSQQFTAFSRPVEGLDLREDDLVDERVLGGHLLVVDRAL